MSFARLISIPSRTISLSDSQKNALAAAMRELSQEAPQGETLHCVSVEAAADDRPGAAENILFIF